MALNTTPATWVAGTVVTAAQLNTEVRDALTGIQAAWTTWSPTYTGITAIGNATVVSRFTRFGKTVVGDYLLTVGSTTTFGATTLTVSLPVAPHDGGVVLGDAMFLDASPVTRLVGVAFESSGTATFLVSTAAGSASFATNTVPFTWTTGDILRFNFQYEAA